MGGLVVDSSVVIGFFRSADAHHANAVTAIRAARLREDTFVLPATVLAESLVGVHRRGDAAADQMRRDLVAFFGDVRVVDEAVAVATSMLRHRHRSIRLPDALVIATGIVDHAAVLTCDKRLAAIDQRVQVVGG